MGRRTRDCFDATDASGWKKTSMLGAQKNDSSRCHKRKRDLKNVKDYADCKAHGMRPEKVSRTQKVQDRSEEDGDADNDEDGDDQKQSLQGRLKEVKEAVEGDDVEGAEKSKKKKY